MLDYLFPILFLAAGLALRLRVHRLRVRRQPVPALLHILNLFGLGTGAFLLVLVIMCHP